MSATPQHKLTFAEYLADDREADVKSEFLNGEMFALAGATRKHNLVASSLVAALFPQVSAHGCEIYAADMRVRIPATDLGTYPDIVVICGEPEFEDDREDTLTNPTLLIEVLSPSTRDYDHGQKFAHYRTLPSLQAYLMVAQDEVHAELYTRAGENRWMLSEYWSLEDVLDLPAIGARFSLGQIYAVVPGLRSRTK